MKSRSEKDKTKIPFHSYKTGLDSILIGSPDFKNAKNINVSSQTFTMALHLACIHSKNVISHNLTKENERFFNLLRETKGTSEDIENKFGLIGEDQEKIKHLISMATRAKPNFHIQTMDLNEVVKRSNPETDFLIINLNDLTLNKDLILDGLEHLHTRGVPFVMIYQSELSSPVPASGYFKPWMRAFDYWHVIDNKARKMTYYTDCQFNPEVDLKSAFDKANKTTMANLTADLSRVYSISERQGSDLESALTLIKNTKPTAQSATESSLTLFNQKTEYPANLLNTEAACIITMAEHFIQLRQQNPGTDAALLSMFKKQVIESLNSMRIPLPSLSLEEKTNVKRPPIPPAQPVSGVPHRQHNPLTFMSNSKSSKNEAPSPKRKMEETDEVQKNNPMSIKNLLN